MSTGDKCHSVNAWLELLIFIIDVCCISHIRPVDPGMYKMQLTGLFCCLYLYKIPVPLTSAFFTIGTLIFFFFFVLLNAWSSGESPTLLVWF